MGSSDKFCTFSVSLEVTSARFWLSLQVLRRDDFGHAVFNFLLAECHGKEGCDVKNTSGY